jgi:phenylalanyl-tRNA synthetase beta chain
VPVDRHYDVTREVDLIEEVGRIHGYTENLVASLPSTSGQAGRLTRDQWLRRRAEDAMRDLGFDIVVNLSLTDPGLGGRLGISDEDPRAEPIRVSNPLSAEHSVERTAMIGSLLDSARYNRAHGAERICAGRVGPRLPARGDSPHDGVLAGKFVGVSPRLRAVADCVHRGRAPVAGIGAARRCRPISIR